MNHENPELEIGGRRHNGDRSPDEIEADIDYTRARMDADLEALEQRLSPGHLIDEAMRMMRTGAAAEYFQNLGETARRNPVPLALVSTGLAWLALSSRPHASSYSADYGYEGAWHGDTGSDVAGEAGASLSAKAEDVKAKVGETWERASGSAGAAVQSARERAHRMSESARHGMHSARDRARLRAEQAREGARVGARRVTSFMYEQPLIAAGVALTVGAVLGGLLPTSRREHELMGRHSDELKHRLGREAEAMAREAEERLGGAAGRSEDPQQHTYASDLSSPDYAEQPLGESAATAGPPGSLLPEEDLAIGEERGARTTTPESASPGRSGKAGPGGSGSSSSGSGSSGKTRR